MWQRSTRKIGENELNSAWAIIDISCWDMHAAKSMIYLYIYIYILGDYYISIFGLHCEGKGENDGNLFRNIPSVPVDFSSNGLSTDIINVYLGMCNLLLLELSMI